MKLKALTFRIFFELHAWVSVLSALALYIGFFAGAFALFHAELDAWASTPARDGSAFRNAPHLQPLVEQLLREESTHGFDHLSFSLERASLRAVLRRGVDVHSYAFVPATGRLTPARSELGSFLYELHYFGPIPNGMYVVGVSALLLGLAIVSGVIIAWKDLVRHGLRFRPALAPRKWAGDLHQALGILGVPFQLLYAWTGAMLCLAAISVEPAVERVVFQGRQSMASIREELPALPSPASQPLERVIAIDRLVARARREIPGLEPAWVGIDSLGAQAAIVRVYGTVPSIAFGRGEAIFHTPDGALLHLSDPRRSNSFVRFEAWFYGLHFARFGGYAIKWVYALLALATCAVIVSGNVVWLERRDRKRRRLGNRLLERLTVGCCAGLPLAIAALFVANRLLAGGNADHSALETRIFWTSYAGALLLPFGWRNSRLNAAALLLAASAGFGFASIFDEWCAAFARDDSRHSVDLGLLAVAQLCALGAVACRKRAAPSVIE